MEDKDKAYHKRCAKTKRFKRKEKKRKFSLDTRYRSEPPKLSK